MEMNVYDDKKQVDIWLTKAEKKDQELREKLKPIYAAYHKKKYLVTVFESGEEDLKESIRGLLEFNRRHLAEREMQSEKKKKKVTSLER